MEGHEGEDGGVEGERGEEEEREEVLDGPGPQCRAHIGQAGAQETGSEHSGSLAERWGCV